MAGCDCKSLSIYLEKVTVESATMTGDGIFEKTLGGHFKSDDVFCFALRQGKEFSGPAVWTWPTDSDGKTIKEKQSAPDNMKEIITVKPYSDHCLVDLDVLVKFFEYDAGDLKSITDEVIDMVLEEGKYALAGLELAKGSPSTIGSVIKWGKKIIKKIINFITGFGNEYMGDVRFGLNSADLNKGKVKNLPWQHIDVSKLTEENDDVCRYKTSVSGYGGHWDLVFYIKRICTRSKDEEGKGKNKEG